MNSRLNDKKLLERIKQGDQVSFKIIYGRYFGDLYGYALTLVQDQQLAEDVLQELFVGLWEKREHLKILNLGAYLRTALRHKVINIYSRNKYVDLDDGIIASLASPDRAGDHLEENDLEHAFNYTLDRLPQKCRNVFYLSRIKEYKNKEIAEELNISIRTVEAHISNALQYFKQHHY